MFHFHSRCDTHTILFLHLITKASEQNKRTTWTHWIVDRSQQKAYRSKVLRWWVSWGRFLPSKFPDLGSGAAHNWKLREREQTEGVPRKGGSLQQVGVEGEGKDRGTKLLWPDLPSARQVQAIKLQVSTQGWHQKCQEPSQVKEWLTSFSYQASTSSQEALLILPTSSSDLVTTLH